MRIDIFLDSSALFAGIWSAQGGARQILQLGEVGVFAIHVSKLVLQEVEGVVKRKAPQALGLLVLLLDRCRCEVTADERGVLLKKVQAFVSYKNDAVVLASAWKLGVDFFVTLDKKHFLTNTKLREVIPFQLGTPGDCIEWYKKRIVGTD